MQVYNEPTVLLAKRVTGEEEVPEGAVAVLTPDAPDVLSHVSVRARNMRVLFAICHDDAPLKEIEQLAGKVGWHGAASSVSPAWGLEDSPLRLWVLPDRVGEAELSQAPRGVRRLPWQVPICCCEHTPTRNIKGLHCTPLAFWG